MRQVGDTLGWLAMISVIAAVLYVSPRVARYLDSLDDKHGPGCAVCRANSDQSHMVPEHTR
jgi:hypothetical protein